VIEEVARVDGMQKLPATLPARRQARGGLSAEQALRRRVADVATARGLYETLGWSWVPAEHDQRLGLDPSDERHARHVVVANPMSVEQRLLRTQLLGSLLDALARNRSRGQRELRLFESGPVYFDEGEQLPRETRHIAVLFSGPARVPTWREPQPQPADFFAAKGILATLLADLRVEWLLEPASEPFLHPGRAAAVLADGERLGWLGELHPRVTAAWDIDQPIAGFEVDLDALVALSLARAGAPYEDLTSYPSVRQDLAVVVGEDVPAARVLEVVRGAGQPLLAAADVFDVYRGAQAGEGRVSLALALEFRAADRTLTDADVAEQRAAIVAALESELGARARV
jgi:phenylalanyl-tRNA synthetase beta chain